MTGHIFIRQAELEDLPRILEIENLCFPPEMAYPLDLFFYYLLAQEYLFYVGLKGHHLSGFVIAGEKKGKKAWLITLDVHPETRREGIGESLTRRVEEIYHRKGVDCLILQVAVNNKPALYLYKKMGFKETDYLQGYYLHGEDAYVMEKRLGQPEEKGDRCRQRVSRR